ncbi:hypothetical protein EJ06DRAFT_463213, partial [Trichodelitschia bisporula]
APDLEGDNPVANAARGVRLFCESGGPNSGGDEVLHLPVIVESAESSPSAAAAAALAIQRFLSKDYTSQPHVQYNAVMLIRILADNPGPTFTRNLDGKFTDTVKKLLRNGKDPSVQQILRESLAALYADKAYDANLQPLFAMWSKEAAASGGAPSAWGFGSRSRADAPPQDYPPPPPPKSRGALPSPGELAQRIEEARTSAKLLQQLVQSTEPSELATHELVREFAQRCQSAQRSMNAYIHADPPGPDEATMTTLIETSEMLALAQSKHSRALLQARR